MCKILCVSLKILLGWFLGVMCFFNTLKEFLYFWIDSKVIIVWIYSHKTWSFEFILNWFTLAQKDHQIDSIFMESIQIDSFFIWIDSISICYPNSNLVISIDSSYMWIDLDSAFSRRKKINKLLHHALTPINII